MVWVGSWAEARTRSAVVHGSTRTVAIISRQTGVLGRGLVDNLSFEVTGEAAVRYVLRTSPTWLQYNFLTSTSCI